MNKKYKFIYGVVIFAALVLIWILFTNYFKYEGCRDKGVGELSVSRAGDKIVFHKCEGNSFFYKNSSIYISNIDGSNTQLLLSSKRKGIYTNPVFSPDQSKVLLVYKGELKKGGTAHEDAIYEFDLSSKKISEIASLWGITERIDDIAYSPDGRKIYFKGSTNHGENGVWTEVPYVDLYSMNIDGSGVTRLTNYQRLGAGLSVSPDGNRLYVGKDYFDLKESVVINLVDKLKTSNPSLNKEFWATTNNPLSDIKEGRLVWIGGYGDGLLTGNSHEQYGAYNGSGNVDSIIYGIYLINLDNNSAQEISTSGYVSSPRFISRDELMVIKEGGIWKLNLKTRNLEKMPL